MPSIQITEGPSNRSLSATNNRDEETFTLELTPNSLLESEECEHLEVSFEFSGDTLWDDVIQTGYIEPMWYPDFFYCGFCKVGSFSLQLKIRNVRGGTVVAESNVWSWEITE